MLEINTSRIKNTVTFTVDKKSLKEATDAILSVKKFAENVQPSINLTKFKRQMKEAQLEIEKMYRTMPKHVPTPGAIPPKTGGGSTPSSAPPRSKPSPADKEAERLRKRADMGSMRMENFSYQASKYSRADTGTLRQAQQIIEKTVALYKTEEITLQRLNQVMAHQLDSIRRSHRAKTKDIEDEVRGRRRVRRELEAEAKLKAKLREKERREKARDEKRERDAKERDRGRRFGRFSEGAMGLSPTMVGSALMGAGLYAGISRIVESLNTTADRITLVSKGAQNVQANPNSIMTIKTWGEINGVDSANYIKAIDNLKDVRERLGDSMMASTFDEKSGKWKGGDNGINDIMNQFGWSKDDIAQFQNNPLDFVQATVNAGQAKGMNSAQIGRLMENLGDDLMHYQRMFMDNGKEYMQTLDMLKRSGATLNDENIAAGNAFIKLRTQMNAVGEGMGNNFLVGFMDAMKEAPNFEKNIALFMDAAKGLGKATGDLVTGFVQLTSWTADFMSKYGPKDKTKEGISEYYGTTAPKDGSGSYPWWNIGGQNQKPENQPLGSFVPDFLTNPLTPNPYSIAGQTGAGYESSLMQSGNNYPVPLAVENTVTIPDSAFVVQVIPDGYSFNSFLDAKMGTAFAENNQRQILMLSGGQSTSSN
ncbi:hypothetical protein [Citrobacter phage Tr1]|nr:hypothetical protein [Citrobacter phage Tr1]